ncbi:MAG: TetR family transcriptional regulator [Betaproteobacteria bacterium]|nr:MAG: TetR family transcriptional regulator [Betaproteobacteria bacterium]
MAAKPAKTSRAKRRGTAARPATRIRDPIATRQRILDAATKEFARLGLGGARVDAIAARAKANKRMIYHYFGSKSRLFLAVLESAYSDIRGAEQALDLEHLEPEQALRTLTEFTWHYYLNHPEFLTLVNSENLHKARHLKQSRTVGEMFSTLETMVRNILNRGARKGVFRKGIDPVQLNITIAAISYYYLTNRYTGSIIYQRDLMAPAALKQRLAFNVETIMRLVRK